MKNKVRLSVFALALIAGIFLAACGPLPAGAEVQVSADGKSAQVEFTGKVDSIAADQWVVAGQTLAISPQTTLDASIVAGDMVKVHVTVTADGKITANSIERYAPDSSSTSDVSSISDSSLMPEVLSTPEAGQSSDARKAEFVGVVETIAPDAWGVSGKNFAVGLQTEIKGSLSIGDTVKVEALVNTDGTFSATEIKLNESGMGITIPSPASGELEMTGTVESIAADQWSVSGVTFAINPQTEIKGTINVGDLVKVEALADSDGALTAREIQPADEASSTPETSSAPDSGIEMEFTGVVESIGPDSWTVGGKTFTINSQTEIKGAIVVGDTVKIEDFGNLDSAMTAREITKVEASADSNDHGSTSSSGILSGDDSKGHDSTFSGGTSSGDDSNDHVSNSGSGTSPDDSYEHQSKP